MQEIDCSNQGPKHLVFMGSNACVAKGNAASDAGSRDVFRQSHLKEAQHMGANTGVNVSHRTLRTMANLTRVSPFVQF